MFNILVIALLVQGGGMSVLLVSDSGVTTLLNATCDEVSSKMKLV